MTLTVPVALEALEAVEVRDAALVAVTVKV
jgi:hypothetical protein